MTLSTWIIWAVVLFAQNYSFTFVSRARNSASLQRHIVAALFSNLIWFVAQLIMVTDLLDSLKGTNGPWIAVFAAIMYTVCTVGGSVLAHYQALHSERGLSAVGANSNVKSVSHHDWAEVQRQLLDLKSQVSRLDETKRAPTPLPAPTLFTWTEDRTETTPQKERKRADKLRPTATPRRRTESKGQGK